MISLITIQIQEDKLPILTLEEGGMKTSKKVTFDVLEQLIVNHNTIQTLEQKEIVFSSPTLPPNTIKYAQNQSGMDFLFMIEPEVVTNIQYNQFTFSDIPFPKMVFAYKINKQQVVDVHCAVYKDLYLRDTTELYRFPYSNVHTNGRLCYFSSERLTDLVQLQDYAYQWRMTKNNDHIYFPGTTNLMKDTLYNVFETFECKPFDESILAPMGLNYSQWSSDFIKS